MYVVFLIFFLMIRRPPRSTPLDSSAASDVYKRQSVASEERARIMRLIVRNEHLLNAIRHCSFSYRTTVVAVSYTHLRADEHLRLSYAVFCLNKQTHSYPHTP